MTEKHKIGDRVYFYLAPDVEFVIKGRDPTFEGAWLCTDERGTEWHMKEDDLALLTPQGRPDPPGKTGTKDPDGENQRSRLAEVLGVEEDEEWRAYLHLGEVFRIHGGVREHKNMHGGWNKCFDEEHLIELINHPEFVIRIPRLTEAERVRCGVFGAEWVSMDEDSHVVQASLWSTKPVMVDGFWHGKKDDISFGWLGSVLSSYFPSVKPGDCVCVNGGAT